MVDQINIENLMAQDTRSEGGGYSALPGLVRELIRTPAFKELVNLHLRGINPDNARELIKTALWEDPGFSLGAFGASPDMVNWLAEALIELGVQLNNFTTAILKDFLGKLGEGIDTEKLKSIPAAYAPLVNDLLLDDREALDGLIAGLGSIADQMIRAGERTWRKIWNTADFGKIRVGLTEHLEGRRAELEGPVDIPNPVAISNLLGVVPPLTNYMLRVLGRSLQAMNLPSEILANAVFQLLEDIDMAEMGGLVNALAGLVNALHRGNLVLGRDEPRFKQVLGRVSRNLVDNVDGEQFKQMLISFKEDGAVIGSVISDYVYATPDNTVQVMRGVYLAVGAALRATAETFRRISELPPEAIAAEIESFEEAIDGREMAGIANHFAVLFNKECDAKPDVLGALVAKVLAGLDTEELAQAGKRGALQVRDAVLADPTVAAALEPEAIGLNINNGLAVFNHYARENPELMASKVSQTLAVIDAAELKKAVEVLSASLVHALVDNTEVLMAVVIPATKATFKAVIGVAKNLVTFKRFKARRKIGG